MGAEPAVRVLYRRRGAIGRGPGGEGARAASRTTGKHSSTPTAPPTSGQIDEVIEPRETRPRLIRALEILRTKVQQNPPKKHGLFPS